MTTHYEILEVAESASDDAIRAAFRRLARKHHPDRGGSAEVFQRVEVAYSTLNDPEQRVAYDATLTAASGNDDHVVIDDSPEDPPEPSWGTESTVRPSPPASRTDPSPTPASHPAPSSRPLPSALRTWTAPPLPAVPGKARRSRAATIVGAIGLGMYVAVLGVYFATALSPAEVLSLPLAVTLLALICLRRALSQRAGAFSIVATVLTALPAVASTDAVLKAPVEQLWITRLEPAVEPAGIAIGAVSLLVVIIMIVSTEVWRADHRGSQARNAQAWDFYHQAVRTKELAEHWRQMLLKSSAPGYTMYWIVHSFPTGSKSNALLEDPRTGDRSNHWLWGRWNERIWVVIHEKTGEVVHWTVAEAHNAWGRIGIRV